MTRASKKLKSHANPVKVPAQKYGVPTLVGGGATDTIDVNIHPERIGELETWFPIRRPFRLKAEFRTGDPPLPRTEFPL